MPGQGGIFNAFPGTYYLEYGSNGINLRLGQNNVVPDDTSYHEGLPVMGWMGVSSSMGNTQTHIRFQDSLAEDGLLPSLGADAGAGAGIDQRLEERHAEPNITPLELYASMSPGNGELTNGQSVRRGTSSSAVPQNIDLNATHEGSGIDSNLDMGTGLCLNPFKPAGSDANQSAPASDPYNSNTLVISSGIAGYVLEESEGGEDRTSHGRLLSCKRRAPEDTSGMSLGESSKSAKQAGSSHQQAVACQENSHTRLNIIPTMNNHLNLSLLEPLGAGHVDVLPAIPFWHQPSSTVGGGPGAGAGASSEMHLTASAVVQEEHSLRNISLRRSANQLDIEPANLSTWITRNPQVQSPGLPPVLFPFDRLPNTGLVAGVLNSSHPMQPFIQVPNSSQTQQPFRWNGVTRSRISVPSSSYTVNGGDTLHQEENLRNSQGNEMLRTEIQSGNFSYLPTNLNFASGTSFPGNPAYSPANGSSSNVHQPSVPTLFPQGAQRMMNIVNHTESQDQGSYCPIHSGASAARERELSPRNGNARHFQMPRRSGLTMRAERQSVGHPDIAVRSLTAAQRSSRLLSEVRNALALVRRGGSLQFEDVLVIDRSVLYGVPEEPDHYQDMRLDVDNMSYEELLDLEEQIGNVCTGLSEDDILAHLKQQKYQSIVAGSPIEEDPCCICQEEYADGEDLGKLNCGHDFHFNCIKQWLVQKNNCPICKNTGLEIGDC